MSARYLITSELPPNAGSHAIRIEKLFLALGFQPRDLGEFGRVRAPWYGKGGLPSNLRPMFVPNHFFFRVWNAAVTTFADSLETDDIVLTSSGSYAAHIVGSRIRQLRPDVTWIADLGDPWARGELFPEFLPSRRMISFVEEMRHLKSADAIFVTTLALKRELKNRYGPVFFIPMGYSRNPEPSGDSGFVLYGGSAYWRTRNLRPLIDSCAFEQLPLKIIGDISGKYSTYIEKKGYRSIQLGQRSSPEAFLGFESRCSVQTVVLNRAIKQIPGKIYQCIANKPTLVIHQGHMSDEIANICAGSNAVRIAENSAFEIRDALRSLVGFGDIELSRWFVETYEWDGIRKKVEDVIFKYRPDSGRHSQSG